MNNLEERIIKALADSQTELWFPLLSRDLALTGWQKLQEELEISEKNYGTARVIFKNVDTERIIAGTINFPNEKGEIKDEIPVEILPAEVNEKYKEAGANFYSREEILTNDEILACARDAFEIIRRVPSLFTTIKHLVKSIHLIKPEDDEFDVSFSEPYIPFSIFISVPRKSNSINILRVSEAIVHEAMHLQMTLIENIVTLIIPGGELIYSPWKEEHRTPQGVFHAIYVFQVLHSFILKILNSYKFSLENLNYLNERRRLIIQQIAEVKDFVNNSSLTDSGKIFLYKQFKICTL